MNTIYVLGTIHLRRRQIFAIFDPYPPQQPSAFQQDCHGDEAKKIQNAQLNFAGMPMVAEGGRGQKSRKFADVLNGWSPSATFDRKI